MVLARVEQFLEPRGHHPHRGALPGLGLDDEPHRPTWELGDLEEALEKLDGITGLAARPDAYLYVACPSAVLKVTMDGTFTALVSPVVVKDCDEELPRKDGNPSPYLREIAVGARGTVYASANGFHCVVKIRPDGKVATV